jgi:cytochrome b
MQDTGSGGANAQLRVWDLVVRTGHWVLVAAFFIAYFSSEDADEGVRQIVHSYAGYAIAAVLIVRVVWGFAGSRYARFRSFLFSPFTALRYFGQLLRHRSKRYIGHSPAGAMMIFALMVSLSLTGVAGLVVYAQDGHGPLTPFVQKVERPQRPPPGAAIQPGQFRGERPPQPALEAHEILGNLSLFLVILHVIGVLWASIAHRENLLVSMITGRKRAGGAETAPNP